MNPGDLILTDRKSTDLMWRAVRFGARLRGHEERHRFGHVALVTRNGTVTEALNTGVIQRPNPYNPDDENTVLVKTSVAMHPVDVGQVMDFADAVAAARWKYSWATIACLGVYCLTGGAFVAQRAGTAICSGFVCDALTRAGFIWPRQPYAMMPADIAKHFLP